jgi:hypothetical protein
VKNPLVFDTPELDDSDLVAAASTSPHLVVVKTDPVRKLTRVRLVPFEQIKLGAERRYLVKGLIPRVGLTVVWGPPKSGKSFWSFDLVMHVALGWEYRGRRVHQGPVVYCAFEGQQGIEARVEAWRQRFLLEHDEPVPFYLQPVTLDLVKDQPELVAVIKATLGQVAPVVVVLDTLNRSLHGSESSDEDMTAYVRAADAIREAFQCSVIVIHHCGIQATRPRGHTSLTGAADAQLSVKRDAAKNIIVEVEFAKDGAEDAMVISRLEVAEVGTDEDGEVIDTCVVIPVDSAPGATKAVPASAQTALDLLRKAIIDAGENPPASNHIPPNVKVVSVKLWRDYCYNGTIADSEDLETKSRAFRRASNKLQERKVIGVWKDWVWIA